MEQQDKIEELEKRISALENALAKYRGFVGGIIFVVSGLWTFISFVAPYLAKKLGVN